MNVTEFQDESKYEGCADCLYLPETVEELSAIVKESCKNGKSLTIQGSMTGIAGAGVPQDGCALGLKNLNKMELIEEENVWYIRALAGVTAEQAEKFIRQETQGEWCLSVFPTEKTATLGGIVATGSKGLQSYRYGRLEDYITEVEFCNSGGEIATYLKGTSEFVDVMRSEGMLGVLVSFKIRLMKSPAVTWGILFQFENDEEACDFVEKVEHEDTLTVLEYMDKNTTDVIEIYKKNMNTISSIPDIPDDTKAMIYLEVTGDSEEDLEGSAEVLIEACMEVGGDPEKAWAMCTEDEVERLRAFRHAASECVNMMVGQAHSEDKRICKLSLDVCRSLKNRKELLGNYQKTLEKSGLQWCIFGHFGNGGPYINIMARNHEEYNEGKRLLAVWIKEAYQEKGTAFGEHGIGKLKKELFCENAPLDLVNYQVRRKERWDKKGIWNPKNMF